MSIFKCVEKHQPTVVIKIYDGNQNHWRFEGKPKEMFKLREKLIKAIKTNQKIVQIDDEEETFDIATAHISTIRTYDP